MTEELLTVDQIASVIQTNKPYVYALIKTGQLKSLKIGRIKVRRSELDRFIRESEGYDLTDPYHVVSLADSSK